MDKKCIVLGFDGVNPRFVRHMLDEGKLPNFRRMMDEGTYAPHCLSSVPTSTPENWTTISTGAWNGTHQVLSFQRFQLPELHGGWMSGYTSKENEAEFVWDALERNGKTTVLLKYPASHPPTMSTGVQVCGCHVRPCAHQIDGAHVFSTNERGNVRMVMNEVPTPGGVKSQLPVLSGEMLIEARGIGGKPPELDDRTLLYGVPDSEKPARGFENSVCKLVPPGKSYHAFATSSGGLSYDRVLISRDDSGDDVIAYIGEGEWSEWLEDSFETMDGTRMGSIRFRLEELSPDGSVVRIYSTQIMDIDGFAFPREMSRELYENAGPFITDIGWNGLGHDASKGSALFHESVMVDLAEHQHQWFLKALRHIDRTMEWDLLMLQAHCIDCANHHGLNLADPVANPGDRETGDRYLKFIEALYESLDRMLGSVLEEVDDDTIVFVISDHGGLPGHMRVDTREVLKEAGYLVMGADGEVDRSRSRAYIPNGLFINVNLEGRDPGGIVPAEEFDRTRDEIISVLHAHVDTRNGLHPYNLVLRKEDARYLGLYGDPTNQKIGDIVYTLREPFGGTHGEQLSTAEFGICSNSSLFLMRGPGVRRGKTLERSVWLTDIVPTICHILGTPPPRDAQGAILYQALENP